MKKIILIGVFVFLAAGCNRDVKPVLGEQAEKSKVQSGSGVASNENVFKETSKTCDVEKVKVLERIALLNDKNKRETPNIKSNATLVEIFYSTLLNQCVYIRQLDSELSGGRKLTVLDFFRASRENVTDDVIIFSTLLNLSKPEESEVKKAEFYQKIKNYR